MSGEEGTTGDRALLEAMLRAVMARMDSISATWMLHSAVPRWFSADLLRALTGGEPGVEEMEAFLSELLLLPVVDRLSGERLAYRPEARAYLLDRFRSEDPEGYLLVHRRAFDYCTEKMAWNGPLDEMVWMNMRPEQVQAMRERVYHLLQFDILRGFAEFAELFRGAQQFGLTGEAATLLHFFEDINPRELPPAYRQEIAFYAAVQQGAEGDAESAIREIERLLRDEMTSTLRFRALVALAGLLDGVGQDDRAIQRLQEAREMLASPQEGETIRTAAGPRLTLAVLNNNLGNLYLANGDSRRAEQSFLSALDDFQDAGALNEQSQALNNLGNLHSKLEQWERALDYYRQSIAMKQRIGDQYGSAVTQTNMAIIYQRMAQDTPDLERERTHRRRALDHYTAGLAAFRRLGARSNTARVLYRMALLYYQSEQMAPARESLGEAMNIFTSLRMPELERARLLAEQIGMPRR